MRNCAATAQARIERSEVLDVENRLLHCNSGTAKNSRDKHYCVYDVVSRVVVCFNGECKFRTVF